MVATLGCVAGGTAPDSDVVCPPGWTEYCVSRVHAHAIEREREWLLASCIERGWDACQALWQEAFELTLDRHPGYWRCASLATHVYHSRVRPSVRVVADELEGARFVVDPMPGQAIFRACLVDALAGDRFAYDGRPLRFVQVLDLDARGEAEIAAKLAELEPAAAPIGEDACPSDRARRCETVALDRVLANALEARDISMQELAEVRAESLDVTLQFCVEPETGRLSRIRAARPGADQAVVERLIAVLATWRVRPIEVDGAAILACSEIDFSISCDPAERVPAVAPLAFIPAQAVYSPEPDWEDFLGVALLRRRDRPRNLSLGYRHRILRYGSTNVTAFCIDPSGRVVGVQTKRRFPGAPDIDAIIRDRVATWRFKPMLVDGEPHLSCTERTFVIQFEVPRTSTR